MAGLGQPHQQPLPEHAVSSLRELAREDRIRKLEHEVDLLIGEVRRLQQLVEPNRP